ncbi:hypothetical protein FIU97_15830 [Roseivivax sp. THAF40]|uniref:DUF3859 domain-containing protein n=1 Tax=unclassified Roseivivax TaxID=2639302 RepID=UPI0012685647|nr:MULTISPECIES: DUF3859 domain-containing protein [unclassified Roseivivax]QFS84224.1 hypothetical protein FIV09_15415 [Roseivivax sp. THAF197b]QFT48052.1 hypothetical protein FIU97_15830 [Roseivivax sp. THAF40]
MRSLIALLATCGPAFADALTYDPSKLALEQGVFCDVPSIGEIEAPGTAAGKIELFEDIPDFQWRTDVVPAVPNVSFGIKSNALDGQLYDDVLLTLTHPPFLDSGVEEQAYVTDLGGVSTSINAYTFDMPEERVTGEWIFRAIRDDEVLYEARFTVVPRSMAPDIAAACEGMPLS